MTRSGQLLRYSVSLTAALLVTAAAVDGQVLTDEDLFNRGITAYNRLPESLTAADAVLFVDALRYLFAYEQRGAAERAGRQRQADVARAIGWLSENLQYIKSAGAKGDDPNVRSAAILRSRGLEAYRQLPRNNTSLSSGHADTFVRAIVNLYALEQRGGADAQVISAVNRLEANTVRLTHGSAAGKADEAASPRWVPRSRKPQLGARGGKGAVVGRDRVTGADGNVRDHRDNSVRKNEVTNLRTRSLGRGRIQLEFDYSYSGERGKDVYLNAQPLGRGRQLLGFGGCCAALTRGSGSASITITKPAELPGTVSSSVDICMVQRGRGTFFCQSFPQRVRW
ncbi:MAG TPA: hypothetical protein VFZ04_05550 [Longimicrobiales bacterium]